MRHRCRIGSSTPEDVRRRRKPASLVTVPLTSLERLYSVSDLLRIRGERCSISLTVRRIEPFRKSISLWPLAESEVEVESASNWLALGSDAMTNVLVWIRSVPDSIQSSLAESISTL